MTNPDPEVLAALRDMDTFGLIGEFEAARKGYHDTDWIKQYPEREAREAAASIAWDRLLRASRALAPDLYVNGAAYCEGSVYVYDYPDRVHCIEKVRVIEPITNEA
jgi:hypothetical protein